MSTNFTPIDPTTGLAIDKGGRPSVLETEKNLEWCFTKTQPYLQLGYSFHKACLLAQIPYTTYKKYYDDDEGFRNKIEREQTLLNVKARSNWAKAIRDGLLSPSQVWLERREKTDFAQRQELTGADGEDITVSFHNSLEVKDNKEHGV